jgi:23S rRNA (cytidine1920-2'-O)/16S rRNA (cytidine1409-2'-O)-methyltransferase
MRLDIHLTKFYNIQSRNKAQELIKAKKVMVNGKNIFKSSFLVEDTDTIIINEDIFYVSRAAYKLKYFLEENNISIENSISLDIGSSTGGFTQILLLNGIKSVTCVDVGSNQLHKSLKYDKRIIVKENQDIREFKSDIRYNLVTCDVSFISILYILEDIHRLSSCNIIILYKPQFEVGRDVKRDKTGVVQDQKAIDIARDIFLDKTKELGWRYITSNKSRLSGKSGNIEELFYFKNNK